MTEHIDELFYCGCPCGCTTVIASSFHKKCTYCNEQHKDKVVPLMKKQVRVNIE